MPDPTTAPIITTAAKIPMNKYKPSCLVFVAILITKLIDAILGFKTMLLYNLYNFLNTLKLEDLSAQKYPIVTNQLSEES